MANRVTPEDVKEIISTETADISSFILAANSIVENKLATSSGLDDATLKEIERWLSAHFLAMLEDNARVVERETGESRDRYGENTRGVLGPGLNLTRYGQQAIVLDTSGTLASIGNKIARLTMV